MTELVKSNFTDDQVALIKRTIARDATNDELMLFFHQANKAGLDPLAKEIYFVKYKGNVSIQTGIDGYYKIAHRSGLFLGNKTEFTYDADGKVTAATCTVKKIVGNQVGEFSATCLMNEYNKKFNLWQSLPTRMLEKCAEAAALRKAFPNELSGLYTAEEMQHMHVEGTEPKKVTSGFDPSDPNQVRALEMFFVKKGKTDPALFDEFKAAMVGKSSAELDKVYEAVLEVYK